MMSLSAIAMVGAPALAVAACSDTREGSGDTTTTTTIVAHAIADGVWFPGHSGN